MAIQQANMDEFVRLLARHTPDEGINRTILDNVGLWRRSQPMERTPILYEPAILMMGQGVKIAYIGDGIYQYHPGKYLILLLPMPLEVTVPDVSPECPALMVGFRLNLSRLASVSLRLDAVDNTPIHQSQNDDPSGIYTSSMDTGLLDAAIRMLRTLSDPVEAAMLGDAILDEIYYRILREDRHGALQTVLQRQAQIQQIARAVDYIHQSMDQIISVEALAEMVSMSATTFYRHFKEVMHLPPLQYAKSIKL